MATKRKHTSRKPPYLDSTLSAEARARDLLGRMTIEQKIRQMNMHLIRSFVKNGRVSPGAVRECFGRMSIGCLEDLRGDPRRSAEAVNALQKYLVEKTRLGIPAIILSECLHGHQSGGATVFPQAIALASTWNPEIVRRMAEVAAKEARAVGATQAFSPNLDLARDPRWGRVEETYGEDPYLASRMGVAYIKGMQGEGPAIDREHLICTAKHFAAHGSPEAGVNMAPVAGGMRDLRTIYLPPFKAAVTEAGVLVVMPAYSEYDGIPASASKLLLRRILREEWGFRGHTFSDYGAIGMLQDVHRTTGSPEEAGKQAVEAGLDVEGPGPHGFGDALLGLVRRGEVSVDLIDGAVSRVLRTKFLAGLFENPYADIETGLRLINCPAHRKLALQVARESIILLKNEKSLLPLDRGIGTIAVIGPNADLEQLGGYSLPKADAVTPLEGIRSAVSRRTEVIHAKGCHIFAQSREGFAEAVEAAGRSDVAVVVLGGASCVPASVGPAPEKGNLTCGEAYDRTQLTLPGVQAELVRAVHGTGTPTVVVLVHGRPYGIPWVAEHAPAILDAWYAGEEAGNALADVLFGKVNPSGKLPVSVPRSVGHVPAFYNHKPSARGFYHAPGTPESPGHDYVFSSTTPLYEFGHGLSYTTFKYTKLRVSPRRILPGGRVSVSVDVRNAGERAGKEVVQLYVNDVFSSVTTPVKALRRFEKIRLAPGQRKTVTFELTPEDIALLDEDMNWVVEPGTFEVVVGDKVKTFEVVPP